VRRRRSPGKIAAEANAIFFFVEFQNARQLAGVAFMTSIGIVPPARHADTVKRRNLFVWRPLEYLMVGSRSTEGEQAMAKEPKKLDELFHDTLKDIYFAEKKILSTLPKMAKAAQSEELRAAFEKHRGETEGQVDRLEQVFAMIEQKPQGKTCAAIVGITDEGAEIMDEYKGSPALDAGLLAAAQAVEHYEISRYGTLKAWAEELGLDDAAELLQETLDEEAATDEALTEIAKSAINQQAEAG
jgi:ferritin-like metal-binding protein YciE